MAKLGLNNNQLKIIAMVSMLLDHLGLMLLPQYIILRVLGRLAFPIFAYMIAEGCRYTKNRPRYLMHLILPALLIQGVYTIAMGSLYQNILVTFALSVITVFAIDGFVKKKTAASCAVMVTSLAGVLLASVVAPILLKDHGFAIDYGFWGMLLPVAVYFTPQKAGKLVSTSVILLIRGILFGELKWFALLALPLLLFYNGERGKLNLKYLFYVFYPAHLVVLYAVQLLLR